MRRASRKSRSILPLFLSVVLAAGSLSVASAASPAGEKNQKATNQLFDAVYANDIDRVQASVENGADVDARDRWGMTPADVAIDRGNYRIAHLLVSVRNVQRARALDSAEHAKPATPPTSTASKSVDGGPMSPPVATRQAPTSPNRPVALADSQAGGARTVRPAAASAAQSNPFDPATPVYGARFRQIDGGSALP